MSIENAISELKNLMNDRLTVSASVRTQYGQNETYYKESPPDAVASLSSGVPTLSVSSSPTAPCSEYPSS